MNYDRHAALPIKDALSPNDLVMLRSGGPALTVVDVGMYHGNVCCQWETKEGRRERSWFPVKCLRLLPNSCPSS
jgi:uncharacterized protein YodC (DUF2158 family)